MEMRKMIFAAYKNKEGLAIIPDHLESIPESYDGLEFIGISDSKKKDGITVFNDQDLIEARLGKDKYHCWQVLERSKSFDHTRTYWTQSDDEAIDYFVKKYAGEHIIVCNSKGIDVWFSEGPCNKKRTMTQMSFF
tara:strand:- start:182 stop:586 length:405 start_codon:yes stop_codon:yes gene_type:complete